MKIKRRKARRVLVGDVVIGGNSPVTIQSMTCTNTADVSSTVTQIKRLEKAGCQIVRVAVLDQEQARAISKIKKKITIPLVADIHFDHRLALEAIKAGADKIRINPGNISSKKHRAMIIACAKEARIPIRVGLNSGSVKRTSGRSLVSDMLDSAQTCLGLFKKMRYDQVVLSLKTHDVLSTIEAYRRMAKRTDVPFHLGITAAGLFEDAVIKSGLGLGVLLLDGLGDTMRVSLTDDPVKEVLVAKKILGTLGLRNEGIEIISCPTCGRCTIDLINTVKKAEKALSVFKDKFKQKKIKIALMGCVVNGPGEARDADIGIAWGGKSGVLFKKGKKIRLIKENELIKTLVSEIKDEVV